MRSPPLDPVEELIALINSIRDHVGDDVVPPFAHLLQTAELMEATRSTDPGLIVAGLVHDLADAVDPHCGDHATAGGALVEPLLGARVARLVGGHVEAKRYLVTVDDSYGNELSANSTTTLGRQGGSMTPAEVVAFRARPDFADLLALRRCDDRAKVPGRPTRPLEAWAEVLEQVASGG